MDNITPVSPDFLNDLLATPVYDSGLTEAQERMVDEKMNAARQEVGEEAFVKWYYREARSVAARQTLPDNHPYTVFLADVEAGAYDQYLPPEAR